MSEERNSAKRHGQLSEIEKIKILTLCHCVKTYGAILAKQEEDSLKGGHMKGKTPKVTKYDNEIKLAEEIAKLIGWELR